MNSEVDTDLKNRDKSMVTGPLFLNIIFYTVPIILTSILQLLFNAADLVIVGQYCGSISVGAVGATGSITNLIVNLFIGLRRGWCSCSSWLGQSYRAGSEKYSTYGNSTCDNQWYNSNDNRYYFFGEFPKMDGNT